MVNRLADFLSFFLIVSDAIVGVGSQNQLVFSAFKLPPYANDTSLGQGVMPTMITKIFQRYDLSVKFIFFSDDSWEQVFNNKEVVAHFPVFDLSSSNLDQKLKTKALEAKIYIYRRANNALALKISGRTIPESMDRKVKRICVPQYMMNIKGLAEKLADSNILFDVALNTGDCKARMMNDRDQAMLSDELHGKSIGLDVDTEDLLRLEKDPEPFLVTDIYVIFNESINGIKEFKALFDQELENMKKNDGLKDVLTRFYEYWSIVY